MSNHLHEIRITKTASSCFEWTIEQLAGKIPLNPTDAQGTFVDRPHDVVDVFSAEGGGNQGILDGLGNRGREAVPGFRPCDLSGSKLFAPSCDFAYQVVLLVLHGAIWSCLDPKGFVAFIGFVPSDAMLAVVEKQLAWSVLLGGVFPSAILVHYF